MFGPGPGVRRHRLSGDVLSAAECAAVKSTRASKGHLAQVDLVRVLTFASVIAVHAISQTSDADNVWVNSVLSLLHYTRSVFFFLTGLVLVYTYRDRELSVLTFLRRRLTLIGVPYLVWTVAYFGLSRVGAQPLSAHEAVSTLVEDIVRGLGYYHLYFLMVSLQFYVLFPLVMRMLRATRRFHGAVLAVSGLFQLGITVTLTYLPEPVPGTVLDTLWQNQGTLVISYQFYLVAGCLAAFHLESFQNWIRAHSRLVLWLLLGSFTLATVWYFVGVLRGVDPWLATGVLQPEMIPWFCAVVLGMYWLGMAWSQRYPDGLSRRLVSAASTRSFGVFLVHPAFIWFLGWVGDGWFATHLIPPVYTAATYVFAIAGSLVLVEVLIRSPLSKALIGRARLRPTAGSA